MANKTLHLNMMTQNDRIAFTEKLRSACCIGEEAEAECTGIHKTTKCFVVSVDDDIIQIPKADMEALTEKGILPANVLVWPGHGPRYMDFNQEFLSIAKVVLSRAGILGSLQHMRRNAEKNAASASCKVYPDGAQVRLHASLTYQEDGCRIDCSAYVGTRGAEYDTGGKEITLLYAKVFVQDEKTALSMLEALLKSTVTRESVITAIRQVLN